MSLDISKEANSVSKNKEWVKKHPLLTGISVLFFIIMFTNLFSTSSSDKKDALVTGPKIYDNSEICTEAKMRIQKFLKSPSTADFPYCGEFVIVKLENDGFKVSSYVDSQNSFGAMLRTDWTIEFHYIENGEKIYTDYIIIGGEKIF